MNDKKKYYKNLRMIVCVGENNLIGDSNPNGNGLLWHIKEELLYFKELTIGNTLIFGANTAKFVPIELMKKNREVIVLDKPIDMIELLDELSEKNPDKKIFICGGYTVYKYFLENFEIEEIYLSKIKDSVEVAESKNPLFLPNVEDYGYKVYAEKEYEDFIAYTYKK